MGLGSDSLELGDVAIIFDGGTTSFLLRKAEAEDTANEKEAYRLVSDCYVYGWMYGTSRLDSDESDTPVSPDIRVNPITGESLTPQDFTIV